MFRITILFLGCSLTLSVRIVVKNCKIEAD